MKEVSKEVADAIYRAIKDSVWTIPGLFAGLFRLVTPIKDECYRELYRLLTEMTPCAIRDGLEHVKELHPELKSLYEFQSNICTTEMFDKLKEIAEKVIKECGLEKR